MKPMKRILSVLLALFMLGTLSIPVLAGSRKAPLLIKDQGIFTAGGTTVTSPGTFDYRNQWEESGAGQTAHVDHANVYY